MKMLEISHVSKSFGSRSVLKDLSFSVPAHSVFGFIGENGAGKTTTMKLILGLLKMDRGEIFVNGEKVVYGENRTNRYIGYLPDVPEFYGFMTPLEYLMLCGGVSGMDRMQARTEAIRLLALVGLEKERRRIHGFSRGMKQRLGIAQALMNRPQLLICDEPTSAFDPSGRKEILDLLSSVRNDTTVLFSTHILSDVERICDEVALLHRGRIVFGGSLEEWKAEDRASGFVIEFVRAQDVQPFGQIVPGGRRTDATTLLYEGRSRRDMQKAMQLFVQQGIPVRKIEMLEPSLETLFMEMTGGEERI